MIVALDGQVLMSGRRSGIGMVAYEMTRELARDERLHCKMRVFARGRSREQLANVQSAGVNDIEICSWLRRGVYLRLWHYLPIPYRRIFREKADVSIFWNYDTPPGVQGASLTYVHDMTFQAYPETMDESVRRIMRRNMADTCARADRILTISEFSKREIVRYMKVPEEKIRVIPCGVDLSQFRVIENAQEIERTKKRYGITSDYFLYVGTLEPRKNLPFLVRAYAQAKRGAKGAFPQLVLGGMKGWHYEGIFDEVKRQGVESSVIFTDYLPREDVPLLMNGAAAFVFPSLYEGFGIPPLEAMACGTPVIVSDRASLPEVVGDAGMVVPIETERPLTEALRAMLGPETREAYRTKGLAHVRQYTWKRAAELLADVCLEFAK